MSGAELSGSRSVIAGLQSTMLTCILGQKPLPGQSEPVRFPDLAFLTDAPVVLVSADNVAADFEVSGINKLVEVLSEPDIRATAAISGDRAYVLFQPADEQAGQITIVMEVRIMPGEPNIRPLGLGGIRALFTPGPDRDWEASEPPVVFAI